MKKIIINLMILIALAGLDAGPANAASSVITGGATAITDTSATLHGSVNPGGESSIGYFRYASMPNPPVFCNDIYGSSMFSTGDIPLGSGTSPINFFQKVTDLESNTTYYYCAVGSSRKQITYGDAPYVKSFTTSPCATCNPTSVTTKKALVVDSGSAYLNGFFNSQLPSKTWFEYKKIGTVQTKAGLLENVEQAPSFGIAVAESFGNINNLSNYAQNFVAEQYVSLTESSSTYLSWGTIVGKTNHGANAFSGLSHLLSGLQAGTVYAFRAVAENANGIIYGDILNFKTAGSGNTTTDPLPDGGGGFCGDGICSLIETGLSCPADCAGVIKGGGGGGDGGGIPPIGSTGTPVNDAIVRFHEGVETVFTRQIVNRPELAAYYGYQAGGLTQFAEILSHDFSQAFGYYENGREIRVALPDIAAYELRLIGGNLTVIEYYDSRVVNVQTTTPILKERYEYEYYFQK